MKAEGEIISFHPEFPGECFIWDRNPRDQALVERLERARAVILPQTVERDLYLLCRQCCAQVFPNYDCRFQWEGKTGESMLFWHHRVPHPRTLIVPRVESLLGEHPEMGLAPQLPSYPLVVKGKSGGEGAAAWLVRNRDELLPVLRGLEQKEWRGEKGFVVQEYLPDLERDLRVTVIGGQVLSYWRVNPGGFHHNLARGGVVDSGSDPHLQRKGREMVGDFCRAAKINLAGFDLVFPSGSQTPLFLEINYTFGRGGLGGGDSYREMLTKAISSFLVTIQQHPVSPHLPKNPM